MIFLLFFPFGGEGGLEEKKYGSFADRDIQWACHRSDG